MTIKTKLQLKLLCAGITQQQVAKEAGVSKTVVSLVLTGKAKSSNVMNTVQKLLKKSKSNR